MLEVLCTILSATVIVSCLVLKLPQIFRIFQQNSSKGLSLNSVLLELCAYSTMLTYHSAMNYPLSTYLEYCFLVPQDLILVMLVLHFKGNLTARVIPFFALYGAVCWALASRLVPDAVLMTCISLVTPISMSSKLLQIASILRAKDAGNVSATTWSLALYSTLARCITTLVQTGDAAVLLNFAVSCSLNTVMTVIIIYYQTPKSKKE